MFFFSIDLWIPNSGILLLPLLLKEILTRVKSRHQPTATNGFSMQRGTPAPGGVLQLALKQKVILVQWYRTSYSTSKYTKETKIKSYTRLTKSRCYRLTLCLMHFSNKDMRKTTLLKTTNILRTPLQIGWLGRRFCVLNYLR